jgi:hypothetical protein
VAGRPCSVCTHPDLDLIDAALVGRRASLASISKHFDASEQALLRHRSHHVPATLALGPQAAEVARAGDLLDRMAALCGVVDEGIDCLVGWLAEPGRAADPAVHRALQGWVREARELARLLAEVRGELDAAQVHVTNSVSALALVDHPELGGVATRLGWRARCASGGEGGGGAVAGHPGRGMSSPAELDLRLALDGSLILELAGYPPDPWQRQLLTVQPHRVLVVCARRVGKTTMAAAWALHRALAQPGASVLAVSRSLAQAALLIRMVRSLVSALPEGLRPCLVGEAVGHVELASGSRITALGGKPEGARGPNADVLVVDEAAYVDPALIEAVAPTVATTGGPIVVLGTPARKAGWLWAQWSDDAVGWERVRVTWEHCPRLPAGFIAEQRRQLTAAAFAREWEAEFTEAENAVFPAALLDDAFHADMASGGHLVSVPPWRRQETSV